MRFLSTIPPFNGIGETVRKKLVAGNWKMHGNLAQNSALLLKVAEGTASLDKAECAVCVPFPYLFQAQDLLRRTVVQWGAQNVSQYPSGAYTGEVSAGMLADFGCRYVIVGHSERRRLYAEGDATVAAKVGATQAGGMIPVVCVGETLEEWEAGRTEAVVTGQIQALLDGLGAQAYDRAVVAYEPVWAIGTGKTASPAQAQAVHRMIREVVAQGDQRVAERLRILYGGSVKAANAAELFAMPDIDGALVGGASLDAGEFLAICAAAHESR